jgi:2-polyprenyl-6-methoxyphenol hydroxylase-like FAD-dependent oxidoreductase
MMQAEVIDLIEENGCIAGVRAKTQSGPLEVRAPLTIGADGRHSIVRDRAGLKVIDVGAPMDVLWMRISRRPTDGGQTFGHIVAGKVFVLINRGDYWQCALVIPKARERRSGRKG